MKNLNIIMAEDDPVNQKVTLLMLKKLGIRAEVAANGLEVLQALEKQYYDVVLMEDDPVNQKVTLLMLKKLGIRAEVAANGLEVLQALEKQYYDVCSWIFRCPRWMGSRPLKLFVSAGLMDL